MVRQQEATRSEIRRLASRFFGDSHEDLVLNILEDRGVEREELTRLREMLNRGMADRSFPGRSLQGRDGGK